MPSTSSLLRFARFLVGSFVVGLGLATTAARAQPLPLGGEIAVNTSTASFQQSPHVGMSDAGAFMVVWSSGVLDGSGEGVFARKFASNGTPFAEFGLNQVTVNDQSVPAIGMNASGDYVAAWQSVDQAAPGSGRDVYARRSSFSGSTLGNEFLANVDTVDFTGSTRAARSDDGTFVIGWELNGAIFARRFDASGAALTGDVAVTDPSLALAVAAAPAGSFVVVYNHPDSDGNGISARLYSAAGAPLGAAFPVPVSEVGQQQKPAVGMDALGNFVVVWELFASGIRARRFAADGAALSGELAISAPGFSGGSIAVDVAADGAFVVSWQSTRADASGGIDAQELQRTGVPVGGPFLVNTTVAGSQSSPAVATGKDQFVVVWESPDADSTGIFGQRFRRRVVFGDDLETGNLAAWSAVSP